MSPNTDKRMFFQQILQEYYHLYLKKFDNIYHKFKKEQNQKYLDKKEKFLSLKKFSKTNQKIDKAEGMIEKLDLAAEIFERNTFTETKEIEALNE